MAIDATERMGAVDVETAVPDGDAPAGRCPHCDRPFPDESGLRLHVGEVHDGAADDDETAAYEAAREAERDDLFFFHLRVVIYLGLLYSFGVVLYMVALGSDLL